MLTLTIANRNYSSWSLRPWLLLKTLEIPFEERLLRFGKESSDQFQKASPTGLVPCLRDGDILVWDTLAIMEYLAESHPGVWPQDRLARAWARSASAEMHSGFAAIRNDCTMTVGQRIALHEKSPRLERELARLEALWTEGLDRFGGPYLAGPDFTAVDAFYAPVAFRVQTYGLTFSPRASDYVARILALPAMQEWYEAALAEDFRDDTHESEIPGIGVVVADYRVQPTSA